MKKRMTAVLLALGLSLSMLTGCGRTRADDFVDVLDEVRGLDNYHLELTVTSDKESKDGVRISGDVAESAGQAKLVMTGFSDSVKEKGALDIVISGRNIYLRPGSWTNYLARRFEKLGTGAELAKNAVQGEILDDAARALGDGYYKVTTQEPVFELLHGDNHKEAADALYSWYKGLRKTLKKDVEPKNRRHILRLKEARLRDRQLDRVNNLLDNEEVYRAALQTVFASVEDSITVSGWTDSDILDTIWSGYRERSENLTKLKEENKWEDKGTLVVNVGERGSDEAYQISAKKTGGETERYLHANIIPMEQARKVKVPKGAVSYSEQAENLATVFESSRTLMNYQPGEPEEADSAEAEAGESWEKWVMDDRDDSKDYSADLKGTPLKGYSRIQSTMVETEDGKKANLPAMKDYEVCDPAYTESGNISTLSLTSDGCDMELYTVDKDGRSLEKVLSENVESYVKTYQEEWEFKITQKPSAVVKNKDGTACVAGFSYFDEDKKSQVTLVNLAAQIKGSNQATLYEVALYGNQVKEENIAGLNELCNYFGLKVPVKVLKK